MTTKKFGGGGYAVLFSSVLLLLSILVLSGTNLIERCLLLWSSSFLPLALSDSYTRQKSPATGFQATVSAWLASTG